MGVDSSMLRASLKSILKTGGLLPAVRRLRARREYRRYFLRLKRRHGEVLRQSLNSNTHTPKIALISGAFFPEVVLEFGVIKALELAGFVPVAVVLDAGWQPRKYYRLAGLKEVHLWHTFADPLDLSAAEAVIDRFESVQELLTFRYEGARVGRFAVSTAFRELRRGSLDLRSAQDRGLLVKYVASGMAYTKAAQRILGRFRPEVALFVDSVYTPKGELFDTCIANGVEAIEWGPAHKNSTLMIRRYSAESRDEHLHSLSPQSWQLLRSMEWTDAHRQRLDRELYSNYTNGEWYSVSGTQVNKRLVDADAIRQRLGISPVKKTAFICPHISWDATLFWGECLFRGYEEWFVETVRAACANDRVNWVIKIHPAHVGKSARERYRGEPAEIITLREHIGKLPPHISLIPPESEISTYSLFEHMDYCLTVRGTIGIEAARLGIPVLTGGTGRYDHRGFTVDSESREQYLDRVAHIQDIPRLSPAQQELAERFAYGLFVLRPLPLTAMTLEYAKTHKRSSSKARINIRSRDEWYRAPDIRALADWMTHSRQPDFLMPLPEAQNASVL